MPVHDNISLILKEGTAHLHRQVEQQLIPKLNTIASYADYAAILAGFYGFYAPLQQLVRQFLGAAELPDIAERNLAGKIPLDIKQLGCKDWWVPECTMLPPVSNADEAFGALYVMEGSSLGGQYICKMLMKHPVLRFDEQNLHFFTGYGQETGNKWKTFTSALNVQHNSAAILTAANNTFSTFSHWLHQSFNYEQNICH